MKDFLRKVIEHYYLSTPIFALLDFVFHFNIRVAGFIGKPGWKAVYYLFCGFCWWAIRKKPKWASLIGMGESGLNMTILVLGIMVPIYSVGLLETGAPPITLEKVGNFLLAGSMCSLSFYGHQESLQFPKS